MKQLVQKLARQDDATRLRAVHLIDLLIAVSETLLITRLQIAGGLSAGNVGAVLAWVVMAIMVVIMIGEIERLFAQLRRTIKAGAPERRSIVVIMTIPNLTALLIAPGLMAGVFPNWLFWLANASVLTTAGIAVMLHLAATDQTIPGGG